MSSPLHQIVERSPALGDETRRKYLHALDEWIAFAGDSPEGWTMEQAQAFYNGLLARGLKPQSAKHYVSALKFADHWYSKQVHRPEFVHVDLARKTHTPQRPALSPEQAISLLDTCRDLNDPIAARDFAMMVIGLETGMRRMSMRSIALSDVLKPETKPAFPHVNVLLKGFGKDRFFVPLSETALRSLGPWIAWLRARNASQAGALFRPLRRMVDQRTGVTGLTVRGSQMSLIGIYKTIEQRSAEAGFGVFPHIFRHTFVTWRLDAGHPPHDVMAITGHSLQAELGAFGGYANREKICDRMRNTTPPWLAEYVRARVSHGLE